MGNAVATTDPAGRRMPIGVDAYGQYFITLPGQRRLRPHVERNVDDDDDDGDDPHDAA